MIDQVESNAHFISRTAASDIWASISEDAFRIDNLPRRKSGQSLVLDLRDFLTLPLWPSARRPEWFEDLWGELSDILLKRSDNWSVWLDGYRSILDGKSAFGVGAASEKQLAYFMLAMPGDFWERRSEDVNSELREIIADFQQGLHGSSDGIAYGLPEPIPAQGPGPHFEFDENLLVDRLSPEKYDRNGNDNGRIERLRPLVIRSAYDLESRLSKNEFPELVLAVSQYLKLVDVYDPLDIPWGEIWGLGVVIRNASEAAARRIRDRMLPELEDPAKAALDSFLTLHAPMVLATREGFELTRQSEDFHQTREQREYLREAAEDVAVAISASPDVATKSAADTVVSATTAMGEGPHPERGATYGVAGIRNVMVPLIAAAVVTSPSAMAYMLFGPGGTVAVAPLTLVAVEGLKKSSEFMALLSALGSRFDSLMNTNPIEWAQENSRKLAPFKNFVIKNEESLRKIAFSTPELRWIVRYIDFIVDSDD